MKKGLWDSRIDNTSPLYDDCRAAPRVFEFYQSLEETIADGTLGLAAARALTGVGVAGLMTSIQMTVADVSTSVEIKFRAPTPYHVVPVTASAR